jgi:predicted nucleic acid-binding protein
MKTALDSSVILDVLSNDSTWADASEEILKQTLKIGPLVVGECVVAEITPALPGCKLIEFLSDWEIQFLPSTKECAVQAGEMYREYLMRSQQPKRVLADFLIGAHAQHHTGRLLARDRGYYRDYFKGLTLIEPKG